MNQIGKSVRLSNIFRDKERLVIIAMDHAPVIGPVHGLEKPFKVVDNLSSFKPNAFMFHRGILKGSYEFLSKYNVPFLLKMTTSTVKGPSPDKTTLVDTVEDAVKFGASGIATRFFMGPKYEHDMLKDLGFLARECDKWGMPLFVMAYPEGFENNYDVNLVKHVSRIAAELGADIVKTYYTGSVETFKEVIETCPVPVVMAGGPKLDEFSKFISLVKDVLKAGAIGVMIGRNIWQAEDPAASLKHIEEVVWNYRVQK